MILGIKTDQAKAELYLLDKAGKELAKRSWEAGRQLSQQLLQELVKLMSRERINFGDLRGVVVFRGPGSFTSLRIGITVANAIAFGHNIKIVGSSSNNWLKQGFTKLPKAKVGDYVVPQYGRPPRITQPRP